MCPTVFSEYSECRTSTPFFPIQSLHLSHDTYYPCLIAEGTRHIHRIPLQYITGYFPPIWQKYKYLPYLPFFLIHRNDKCWDTHCVFMYTYTQLKNFECIFVSLCQSSIDPDPEHNVKWGGFSMIYASTCYIDCFTVPSASISGLV